MEFAEGGGGTWWWQLYSSPSLGFPSDFIIFSCTLLCGMGDTPPPPPHCVWIQPCSVVNDPLVFMHPDHVTISEFMERTAPEMSDFIHV